MPIPVTWLCHFSCLSSTGNSCEATALVWVSVLTATLALPLVAARLIPSQTVLLLTH